MPIIIKGNGGSQKTPSISVNSSGLITATAGNKSATKQLSSSDDSDFIASNIKSGVSIFGVNGSLIPNYSSIFSEYTSGDGFIQFTANVGSKSSNTTIILETAWIEITIGSKYNSTDKKFVYVTNNLKTTGYGGWSSLYQLDNGLYDKDSTATLTFFTTGEMFLRIESEAFAGLSGNTSDQLYVYSVRGSFTVSFESVN